MRKSALWIALLLVVASAPVTFAQLTDPCRAWTCVYEYREVEAPPYASCYEIGNSRGQWVACNIRQQCWWVETANGRQRQCTLGECEGESCMWV
jgi:hypothetical protein